MKQFFLLLVLLGGATFGARGQAPTQTADDYVRPYAEAFQYGTNLGYYGGAWSDEALTGIAQALGGHSVRPTLPEYFLDRYGYSIRASTFESYVKTLGMKEITVFVEGPSAAHRDPTIYPGAPEPSKLFAHLYEPIWNSDGSVNPNNYYAYYLYNTLLVYGDKVRFWEIVNEPDFTYGGSLNEWLTRPPAPGETANLRAPIFHYIRMLRISYEVIKKYHPEAYVTTGGVGYPQFVDALLRYTDNPADGVATAQYPRTGGAYLDALSFHSYPAYSLHYWDTTLGGFRYTRTSDYAARRVLDDRQAMADVLRRYGYDGTTHPAKHLLITETNISRRTADDRTGSDEMQRNFGIKTLVLAQKNDIKQLYYFSLGEAVNAPAPGQVVSGADEIALMGLYENLNRDGPGAQKTTQLGQAFATTSQLLYGAHYDAARTAALALPTDVEGAAFGQNGSYRYVLWAKALTDNSEQASATYSFPAAWHLTTVQRAEWDYATTTQQTTQAAQGLALSGTPAFFSENPAASPPPGGGGGSCAGTGNLLREQWDNVTGSTLADLPLATPPTSSGLLAGFVAQTQTEYNYGARLRGYLCPPQSGTYTFWVAGDDAAELWLSPDEEPAHQVRLASCLAYTTSAQDFLHYPGQQSVSVSLQAGQRYYVEARHKQAWGPGYVAVAWQWAGHGTQPEPIPATALLPWSPRALASAARVAPAAGTRLTVYPNPFSRQASVEFSAAAGGPVTLTLHNAQGQLVRQLFAGAAGAGVARTVSLSSAGLEPGLYFVRLTTQQEVINQKLACTSE